MTVSIGSDTPARTLFEDQPTQLLGITGTPEALGIQSGGDEADGEPLTGELIVDEVLANWNSVEQASPASELEEITWQHNSQGEHLAAVDLLLENWFSS